MIVNSEVDHDLYINIIILHGYDENKTAAAT